MALTELQHWIMRELGARNGLMEEMPVRAGVATDEMELAIDGLRQRQYVQVIGPPNQNSGLSKDVDELRLLPYGVEYCTSLAGRSSR